jgi:hypothetical protein
MPAERAGGTGRLDGRKRASSQALGNGDFEDPPLAGWSGLTKSVDRIAWKGERRSESGVGNIGQTMDSTRLRSRPAVWTLAGTLLTLLILGVLVVHTHRVYDRPAAASVVPMTDEQSRRQVVEVARQFASAGKLKAPTAEYLLVSCTSEDQPPYQGIVYLNFDVPRVAETAAYFDEIQQTMGAAGWREGEPPGRHPGGRTLAKDGLVAIYHRHRDLAGRGELRIYGECRNVTDHRFDAIGFVDVTGELLG